ncbi:MAG: DUF3014 domain-containing protein [Thiomonas sp.]
MSDPLRPPQEPSGSRVAFVVAVVLALALLALGWLNWGRVQEFFFKEPAPSASAVVSSAPVAPAPPASVASAASEPVPAVPPQSTASLPKLGESDAYVLSAITGLVGQRDGLAWLLPKRLILHIVATIDNLPRQQVALQVWPVKPAPGPLRTTGQGGDLSIAPDNAQRYAPYMRMLGAAKPERAVAVYLELYPLFEDAWRELGHPKQPFNARLLQVIDNLLAAPEPQPPVRLVQPKVLLQYADPALEAASAGQKFLMRSGLHNERQVKVWLRTFRSDLLQRLQSLPASAPAQ